MRDVLQVVLRDGQPDNPKLFLMAQNFANEQKLGSLSKCVRLWCVVEQEETNGDAPEPHVIGLLAMETRADITTCHVADESCRPMLIKRVMNTLMDLGLAGKYVLLYVDPEVEQFIEQKYLVKMGAVRANRWAVPMAAKVVV